LQESKKKLEMTRNETRLKPREKEKDIRISTSRSLFLCVSLFVFSFFHSLFLSVSLSLLCDRKVRMEETETVRRQFLQMKRAELHQRDQLLKSEPRELGVVEELEERVYETRILERKGGGQS
jgi:hypothetical protein